MKCTDFRKRVSRQKQILQHFWTRWKNEYLTSLRESHRAAGRTVQDIKIGDVVLVHNDGNRLLWKLAIIKELIHGRDNYTRAAILKTDTGTINRPITKLYPLEVPLENETNELLKLRRSDRLKN